MSPNKLLTKSSHFLSETKSSNIKSRDESHSISLEFKDLLGLVS